MKRTKFPPKPRSQENPYLNLIRKICWQFHKRTGIDWDELFSEAITTYYETIPDLNSKKGKPSVWVYKVIKNRLINFCKEEQKHLGYSLESIPNIHEMFPCPNDFQFFEFVDQLSEQSTEIAELILKDPHRFLGSKAIGEVWTLLKEEGWSYHSTWRAISTMKQEIRAII